jgi:hypothetical protein
MPARYKQINTPSVFIKKRLPRSIEVFDLRTRKRIWKRTLDADISSAQVCFTHTNRELISIGVSGNREYRYFAKTGRINGVVEDPLKEPRVKKALGAFMAKWNSRTRFALVRTLSRRCTLFYDFADGTWDTNRISATSMIKEREVAEAAAKALTLVRKTHFLGDSVAMQVVEFRKTSGGGKILSSVTDPWGRIYRPVLCRDKLKRPSPPECASHLRA